MAMVSPHRIVVAPRPWDQRGDHRLQEGHSHVGGHRGLGGRSLHLIPWPGIFGGLASMIPLPGKSPFPHVSTLHPADTETSDAGRV